MIKRFPSGRNQRSKGVRIKHVLQVILLLGVCFWLIYQVKHNHDKKKEFDKNDSTLSSVRTETDKVSILGRKDLNPVKDEVDQIGKHEEEEDEPVVEDVENKREEEGSTHETEERKDNAHEGREEQDEGENKHGTEEEQEEGENKTEEIEDEGDVEIDENDHEKTDVDNDQDDEDADELKDKVEDSEEMENEDKEDEEKGGSVENDENHEAREEHYKGDDASSAVAHDTQATSTETEPINLPLAGLSVQMNIEQPEQPDNGTTFHSDENNKNQNDSDLKDREGEAADAISSSVTAGKETGNTSLSIKTAETNTDSGFNVRNNMTEVFTEASNNSTGAGDDTANSSEQIKTVIVSESDNAQNATTNITVAGDMKQTEGLEQSGNIISEGNLSANDATVSVKPEKHDAALQQSPTLVATALAKPFPTLVATALAKPFPTLVATALAKPIEFVASNETDNISGNVDKNVTSDTTEIKTSKLNVTQNIDATVDEMFKGNTQTGETDEKPDSSSANEILDSVIHDAIDLSDTQNIHEDIATARTDLDTLPDIQNEGNDSEENSAE